MAPSPEGPEVVELKASRSLVVALTCCILPTAVGLPTPFGDAGTGGDAGDEVGAAMPLAYGAYEGNLTPADADWFSFAGGGLGCVDLTAMASTAMRFAVGSPDAMVGGLADEGVYRTTLAVDQDVVLGVLPDEEPWAAGSVGPYSFAMSRSAPWAVGDTRDSDAGGNVALAGPIPEECFLANFRHDGPDLDAWTFQATEMEVLSYSFAVGPGATGTLDLYAPNGTLLDTLADGEARQRVASTSGTYALRATSADSWDNADYVIGISLGPDPSTCRPFCLALS